MQLSQLGLPPSAICDSEGISRDLATKSIRGGLATVAAQAALFLIGLGNTAVLARLLTPTDYGLVGMVTVVIGFAAMFKEFGLSTATIQRTAISREQLSALFWVNLGTSVLLAACLISVSPLVGKFYGEPSLGPITAALALSLPLSGISVQHAAVLRRHVRLAGLSLVAIAANLVGLGVAVGLALSGFRYWALVGGTLATAFSASVFTFTLSPWIPGRFKRGSRIQDMLGFGANVTAFEFVNYFSRNLDNILVGRYVGSAALGFYSRAYSLFMMPITQIRTPVTQVALPVLSSLKEDPERYAKYFYRITDILAMLVVPLTTLVIVEADFFVDLLLGPQWREVVPLFRILAVVGLVQGVLTTRGIVMLSLGLSKRYLRNGVAGAILLCTAFAVGLHWGITGVATAYAVAEYVFVVPSMFYCLNGTPVSVGRFVKTLWLPAVISLLAAGAALLARYALGEETFIANVVGSASFVLVYAALSSLRPLVRDTVRQTVGAVSPKGRVGGRRAETTLGDSAPEPGETL